MDCQLLLTCTQLVHQYHCHVHLTQLNPTLSVVKPTPSASAISACVKPYAALTEHDAT